MKKEKFIIFIGLCILFVGITNFWIGYHNMDIAHNEEILECQINKIFKEKSINMVYDIRETNLSYEINELRKVFLDGTKSMIWGFYISLFGMFLIGYGVKDENKNNKIE